MHELQYKSVFLPDFVLYFSVVRNRIPEILLCHDRIGVTAVVIVGMRYTVRTYQIYLGVFPATTLSSHRWQTDEELLQVRPAKFIQRDRPCLLSAGNSACLNSNLLLLSRRILDDRRLETKEVPLYDQ